MAQLAPRAAEALAAGDRALAERAANAVKFTRAQGGARLQFRLDGAAPPVPAADEAPGPLLPVPEAAS